MSGQTAPPRSKSSAKKRAKKPASDSAPLSLSSNPASAQFVAGGVGVVGGGVTIHHPGLSAGEDEIEVGVSISSTTSPEDFLDPRFRDLPPSEQLEQLSYLENWALPGLPGAYPTDIHTETYYQDLQNLPAGERGPLPLPLSFSYPNSTTTTTTTTTGQTAPNGNWLNEGAFAGIAPALNITHEDLVQAANELYRRMADPEYGMEDPYWANLTPNLRAFVREAVPINPQNRANGVPPNTHDIHAMAQRIVKAASEGMNLDKGLRAGMLAGVNGGHQQLAREMGFHPHPDAKEDEFDDEEELDLDDPEYAAAPNGDAPKKKNKKKKKKSATANAQTESLPPVPLPPPPAVPQNVRPPVKQPPPRQPVPAPQTQPALNPPPPPTTPAPVQPAPTSRAAGKKPMANPPANQPARSAKAAGKEPAAANGTHHHHNHATTTSKTTSAKGKAPANAPPAKIWTQSSIEDRDNIRGYWLGLSEEDRRGLLRVEKEAVLRKMKEHHRNACGCAVCGRKKVNIEMELDQLYEQYYSELRSYAAEQRLAVTGQRPPPAGAGPFPGSVEVDTAGQVIKFDHLAPDPRDELDEEGSEEYDDEEYDDEEELDEDDIASDEAQADETDDRPPPSHPHGRRIASIPKSAPRPDGEDFLGFGTGLATIKGILTIADDLLKNDGGKFLDMMEQLAVARSVREEQNIRDMEEPENDLDDEKDEPVTEEERMEEGKRMFQIFAARMFEQRVLQSYRERVAKEREEQLLRELEEEENEKKNKEEKKAKEAQKKKDKKRLQKEKAEKEKAERDAEAAKIAAEAKAKKEEEERERNKKLEEDRLRREAVKKAAAEEQARQAAERRKRQQEEKEREEEAARKRREKDDKAKKEREAREKEIREREKREKEERMAKEKAEKDRAAKEKAEKAERDRLAKEQAAAAVAAAEKERLRLEEERKKEEAAEREREAAEQAKALLARQAQRAKEEKAAAEKAAAERAAAEKRVAAAAAAAANAAASSSSTARKSSRNGPTPHTTPPDDITRAPGAPTIRPGKTPQPFLPQPVPVASYPTRMPVGPSFAAPGFRPQQFPPTGPSPAFSPPSGSSHPPSLSPNPPARGFGQPPSPPANYDLPRSASIGMGYPMKPPSGRVMSLEETFSPPSAPIGMPSGRTISAGELNQLGSLSLEDPPYRGLAAPGPPGAPGAGSIGRPPVSSASSAYDPHHLARTSPPGPAKILGSAALLSTDDEIIQPLPSNRRVNGGWDSAPLGAPPGLGSAGGSGGGAGGSRWSAAPTIWSNAPEAPSGSPWGMPTIGESRSASGGAPPGAGAPVPGGAHSQGRNPSFSMGGAFGGAFGGGLFTSGGSAGGQGQGQGQGGGSGHH